MREGGRGGRGVGKRERGGLVDVTAKYILSLLLEWSHCNNSNHRFGVASKLEACQKYLCLTGKFSVKKILSLLFF